MVILNYIAKKSLTRTRLNLEAGDLQGHMCNPHPRVCDPLPSSNFFSGFDFSFQRLTTSLSSGEIFVSIMVSCQLDPYSLTDTSVEVRSRRLFED